MTVRRLKRPRLKLDKESYARLWKRILERDGWRCQNCSCLENLQVHHIQPRSLLGHDSDRNLITLCVACHQRLHDNAPNS
jgi:5-methylcytosine-specific restriction endonuclease McrA